MTDRYHHGNLPDALRAAAAEVITEKGVGSFSLREVARRAGVSHAAPAHHFGDTAGLLTSLAVEGLQHLYETTSAAAAAEQDPVERLIAIGRAYVEVAVTYPAHCAVVFRHDLISPHSEAYVCGGADAYGVLEDAVRAVAAEHNPDLNVDDAAKLCWTSMQGLVVLQDNMVTMDEGAGRAATTRDDLVVRLTQLMIDGFRAR